MNESANNPERPITEEEQQVACTFAKDDAKCGAKKGEPCIVLACESLTNTPPWKVHGIRVRPHIARVSAARALK